MRQADLLGLTHLLRSLLRTRDCRSALEHATIVTTPRHPSVTPTTPRRALERRVTTERRPDLAESRYALALPRAPEVVMPLLASCCARVRRSRFVR
jgi:ribosomal protein L17